MEILFSALQRHAPPEARDHPAFTDLLENVRTRVDALGTTASEDEVQTAVLELVQEVAQFTLAWVEGDDVDIAQDRSAGTRLLDTRYREGIHAERGC